MDTNKIFFKVDIDFLEQKNQDRVLNSTICEKYADSRKYHKISVSHLLTIWKLFLIFIENIISYILTTKFFFWSWYGFLKAKKSRLCPKI